MQYRKINTVLLAVLIMVVGISISVNATDPIKVYLDGKIIATDSPPQIINDRLFLPVRAISEAMGAQVTWKDDEKSVYIVTQQTSRVKSKLMVVNGETTTWPYWEDNGVLYLEYHNAMELIRMEYNPIYNPVSYSTKNELLMIGNRIVNTGYSTKDNFKTLSLTELKRSNVIDYEWNSDQGKLEIQTYN
ncbi:MAG: copper amine oxidase N-terminal domain-containing protein [Methylocystaceae bacterium]